MAKKSSGSSRPAKLKTMKSEDIKNRQWTDAEQRTLKRISEHQASKKQARINFEGIPRLTDKQLENLMLLRDARRAKIAVSVRLDPTVLEWLKSKGAGHLTRINDILNRLMEAERAVANRPSHSRPS